MLIAVVAGVLLSGGCQSTRTAEPTPPPEARQPARVEPVAAPAPAAAGKCGACQTSRTYPAGDVVRLDIQMPPTVPLNAEFGYTIKVTNLSDMLVSDVAVAELLPKNFRFVRSDPLPKADGARLVWTMASLDAKASEVIKVWGTATNTDCLTHCATVAFLVPACASAEVVEPKLVLTKTAPKEVILCNEIPVKFVVTNTGTGAIQGVRIIDTLPAGLKTADGRTEFAFDAGTLGAGQSKEATVMLKASKTGEYVNRAVATSTTGLKAEATTTTVVRQPVLAITKSGRPLQYSGRPVTYEILVTNKGDGPAVNTIVEDTIPVGVRDVKLSAGGTVTGSKAVWQLGTLPVNASKNVTITYTPAQAGALTNTATATAVCANAVTASAKTSVVGIAAVLLEVVDVHDPIEVGGQETYIITATNQGSSPDTNVQITCTLEPAQQYVSSSGVTTATVQGNTIRFAPLPTLAPKAKATWQVVVKALKPGDIRFTVSMKTDELDRSVDETEATQQY